MSAAEDLAEFDRERREADARYNDALTAFDRIVADVRGRPLMPEDADRLSHALVIYLQQITAFVDTKDRALAAELGGRIASIAATVNDIDELRTRLGVVQRQIKSISPVPSPQPPATGPQPQSDDIVYVGFEDAFRGSDAAVSAKVAAYVPIFSGASDVVDLGCGRGEMLAALRDAHVSATGVDTNAEMVAVARERGLDVQQGDALAYLASRSDESIGGAIATQVIEHLQPAYLLRLLETLSRKLRPGAPVVLETINAACWLAFFSSYIRDITHVRPIHPETLQYMLRATGFERVAIRFSAPVPDAVRMKMIDLPAAILSSTDPVQAGIAQVAHAVNANAAILNSLLFTHLDFAAIAYRS